MIYFTELENLPVFDVKGEFLGRLADLCVDPSQNALRVTSYLVNTPKKGTLAIPYEEMQSISVRAAQTTAAAGQIRTDAPDEALLRMKKDVLDQQIIDVNHRKVVRVSDIDFDIQPADGHTELRIVAVDVGIAAGIRRLLQGAIAKHRIRALASLFRSRLIPWEFVSLIESDPSRRVKLRISYDRLAKLHPADIADILEDLSRDEQRALVESLDDETAAEAISEIPTKMQAELLASIPSEKAADIVEEMPPDEAADVLQEMQPEASAGVLADMEKDEAQEVRSLLGFEEKTAGALMTTEFMAVSEEAKLQDVIEALRNFDGKLESVHMIYLVDTGGALAGAVSLAQILLAETNTPLRKLCTDPVISVESHTNQKTVVDLFHKYNLLTLPVVDEHAHVLGIVTADDVLELVVNRR